MSTEIALYLVLLIFLNFCCPLFYYRKSKRWDLILLSCGWLWFLEAFLVARGVTGSVNADPIVKALALSTYVPIPYILGLIGTFMLLFKHTKPTELLIETN